MDWSNETVLEFIELLHEEPCIWNHKSKDHKSRNLLNEAWVRISKNFSVPCSVEELKKKRNSLLTQYRDCLRRIKEKESTQTGVEGYRPSWFAFDAIDSYMGDLYDYRPKISGESVELLVVEDSEQSESDHGVGPHFTKFRESTEEQPPESPHSRDSNTERSMSRESTSRKRKESNEDPLSDSFQTLKRQRRVQHLSIARKQMENDFSLNKVTSNCIQNEEAVAECDLYGQLLAQKLKPLDVDDRLVLMNEIDNLVFKYMINIRKRNKSRYSRLSSANETNSDNRRHIDLPGPSSRSNQRQDSSQRKQNSQLNSNYEEPFRIIKAETET